MLIPNVIDTQKWGNLQSGARCYYNNDSIANDSLFGALYNWFVISDSGKISPTGTFYNGLGKPVIQQNLSNYLNEIEINLSGGLYLVNISNKVMSIQNKLIIE